MSVQGEIDRIKKNVDDTLKVISDTGVTVGTDSNALPAAARALANEKQDKLTGTAGQFVGFGPDGNATPKNVTAGDVTFSDGKTFQQKYDAGQLTGPVGPPGPQGPKGIQGPAGANGKSPYQVAVEGGYSGTEQEFNASLKSSGEFVKVVFDLVGCAAYGCTKDGFGYMNKSGTYYVKRGMPMYIYPLINPDMSSSAVFIGGMCVVIDLTIGRGTSDGFNGMDSNGRSKMSYIIIPYGDSDIDAIATPSGGGSG